MKLERNNLCHCGSGRKYKNCCYAKDRAQEEKEKNEKLLNSLKEKEQLIKDDEFMKVNTLETSGLDYVSALEKGVHLKHLGKYEEAKEMYIKAIHMDNTHPNGYYNLGKILYILGEYQSSAKAYKAAYERGICELMQSMQPNPNMRIDFSSFYIHVGHSLLDEQYIEGKYAQYVREYQEGINPFLTKGYVPNRGKVRNSSYNEYDKLCIKIAKEYLEGLN